MKGSRWKLAGARRARLGWGRSLQDFWGSTTHLEGPSKECGFVHVCPGTRSCCSTLLGEGLHWVGPTA